MALFRLIAAAQNGQAFANLGRRFFLREAQAGDVVRDLVELLSEDFQNRISDRDGLAAVLHCLASYDYAHHCEAPGMLTMVVARGPGQHFLQVLGRRTGYSREVLKATADGKGTTAEVVADMLPYVAVLFAGALKLETTGMLQRIAEHDAALSPGHTGQSDGLNDPFAVLGQRVADNPEAGSGP